MGACASYETLTFNLAQLYESLSMENLMKDQRYQNVRIVVAYSNAQASGS
jgi:hypothetical protein